MNEFEKIVSQIETLTKEKALEFVRNDPNIVSLFHWVFHQGPLDVLKVLVESLSSQQLQDISAINKSKECESPFLDRALLDYVKEGSLEFAERCLKLGADEHAKNSEGKTAVDLAEPRVADWFIQTGRKLKWQHVLELGRRITELEKKTGIYGSGKILFFGQNLPPEISKICENSKTLKFTSKL